MLKLIFFILVIALLPACKRSLQNQLVNTIENCGSSPSANCKVILADLTKFEWDKMYIFESWTPPDSISNVLGFKYTDDGTYDDTQRLIFTKDKRLVYVEDIDYLNGPKKILFDLDDTLFRRKRCYTSKEAVFTAVKNNGGQFAEFSLSRHK